MNNINLRFKDTEEQRFKDYKYQLPPALAGGIFFRQYQGL